MEFNRRWVLSKGALAASLVTAPCVFARSSGSLLPDATWKIHGFSKHFQDLTLKQLVEFSHKVGWHGVDLTVRKGGHIAPEESETKLKEWVQVLNSEGLSVETITTDLIECRSTISYTLLKTAASIGVKTFRLAYWMYKPDQPIIKQLDAIRIELDSISEVCRELSITAGYQNHSGERYVGASLWDVWYLLKERSPLEVSAIFDIGHAVAEGALSWVNDWRLLAPHVSTVYVKDFQWLTDNGETTIRWCPFGKGAVPTKFFHLLKESGFAGPISFHHEYPLPTDKSERIRIVRADTESLVSAIRKSAPRS